MDIFPAAKEIKEAVGDLRTLIRNANAVVLEVHRLVVAFQEAAARTAVKEMVSPLAGTELIGRPGTKDVQSHPTVDA